MVHGYVIVDLKYSCVCIHSSTKFYVLQVDRKFFVPHIGHLEKRLRDGYRKRQGTLIVSHKARP